MGKKQSVHIRRLNWDVSFYADMLDGNGFQIIEPSGISINGMKKKSLYGASSPLYGTSYEDEQSFIERYRCSCGEFKGRLFEGEECPLCHTKVEYKSSNINVTGWISLGIKRCINPYYFNILLSAIGKNVFTEIIFSKYRVTTDGQRKKLTAEDHMDVVPESIYSFIGMNEFYNNYEEILTYFKNKKKNKAHTFDVLLKEKRAVFTSHIPVYSTMLRPQSITSDTFYFGSIDKIINTLYSLSEHLKDATDVEEDYILERIQKKVNKMWDINLELINGKEGWVRHQLLGGSMNYTARNVIIPDPTLHDNEVDLSYNTFLEMYKYKIIYYIMQLDNTSLSRAYETWKDAFRFDEKVYQIMLHVLDKEQPRLLINRNPTLNYYSMILMKIRTIKKDITDYTLSVPLSILPGLNADFDGDILNIIGLMNKAFVFMFRKYDPVMRMIISRDSRLINEYFSINKGQLIDLYTFATYDGEDGCNTEEYYPEEETIQKDKFSLLVDSPIINNTRELKAWLKDIYILEDYLESYEQYRIFQTKIYNILKGCFVIPQCRDYPIRFKFTANSKEYVLPLRLFIINTILWYPFVELNGINVLDESFIIFNPEVLPNIENYLNDKLISILTEYHVKPSSMNYAISEVLYNLRGISNDYSIILGLDFNIPMFTKLYSENDRIREIMECHFENDAQPHEIEQELSVLEKEFIGIISGMKDNHLGIALRAQTGVKHKQLTEFAISEGLKPDISGRTIPIPIQTSTLIGGTNTPSAQYIDAAAARKSLIMNKKVMGIAGHFGKTVLMSARTLSMSTEVSDCGTKHLVAYDVLNKTILKKLTGKFYRLTDDPEEELKLLNAKKDKNLIGKTIYVRSAATCACRNQHHVCAKCVGLTAVINADISDGISAFESEEITKVVNQNILSAKHLLSTNSEEIKFNKEFYDFFTIVGGEINPIVNENSNVNIKDYAVYVDPSDIVKMEEMDDDSLYNTVIETGRFFIRNINDPSEPDIVIQVEGEKEIFIEESMLALLRSGNNMIKFTDLEDDDKLFEVIIMNNELTKPLYELMHLLDKQSKDTINIDIDYISNKFLSLVIDAKIDVSAIACELIINRLIRSAEDIYRRPDFSKDTLEPYVIFTVRKSLEKNPSPLMGIGFQNIKRQLLSNDLFEKRTETSYIDNFFKPTISTENLSKYAVYYDENSLNSPK